MGFKLLYTNLAGPQGDFLVDPSATFEAGMLGGLQGTTDGNPTGLPQVILADSGTSPIGVIDDNKNTSFLATVVDEFVATTGNGGDPSTVNLNNANVISDTFGNDGVSNAILVSAVNGTASGTIAGNVSYSYTIPGKAGDDTTLASGKCTLWLQQGEYSTDVYEVADGGAAITYTVGETLFSSANAKLTNAPSAAGSGSTIVGYVTKAPSAGNPFMNFFLQNTPYRLA